MNDMIQDVSASLRTVLFRLAFAAACVVGVVFCLHGLESARIWAIGCLWGLGDTLLMFNGVRKGTIKPPEEALAVMQRTMLERLAAGVSIVVVMLKLKLNVFGVFIGFILLHIFLIMNLIIIARRKR